MPRDLPIASPKRRPLQLALVVLLGLVLAPAGHAADLMR